jgi:hypothetical protein
MRVGWCDESWVPSSPLTSMAWFDSREREREFLNTRIFDGPCVMSAKA